MSRPDLQNLRPGSKVLVKRNLDHPTWMESIPSDPRTGGGPRYRRDESVEEIFGQGQITAIGLRSSKPSVRVSTGFWYTLADGFQEGSKETLIERIG